MIVVLAVGEAKLFQAVENNLQNSPNHRRIVLSFQIDEAREFGFTNWAYDGRVDGLITTFLEQQREFIYYRGGPNFNAYPAPEQLELAVTEIMKLN